VPGELDGMDTGLTGTVIPLAWTKGHLVIGTSNGSTGAVYFYNPNTGKLSNSENVGPLTGLSALGNSGRVAFTTLDSSGMNSRISVVGHDGHFVSSNRNTDCARSQSPISANVVFPYGPTLLSIGNNDGSGQWRFAVPMKDTRGFNQNDNRLLAYAPYGSEGNASNHCIQSSIKLWEPAASLAGMSGTELLFLYKGSAEGDHSAYIQQWNSSNSSWTTLSGHGFRGNFFHVLGIAADNQSLWVANQASSSFSRLAFAPKSGGGGGFQTSVDFSSLPILDSNGKAYVVSKPSPDCLGCPEKNYELRYYGSDMSGGYTPPTKRGSLLQKDYAPVGSPIFGQPTGSSPAEIYVVTTNGVVYTFDSDTLDMLGSPRAFLNKAGQPIHIHPMAQPVLKGNRLWIIGTQGEIRAMVVNSNGLSTSARWPKMHRDNCNSNSYLSSSLPNCF
jgi:hypothetical protein